MNTHSSPHASLLTSRRVLWLPLVLALTLLIGVMVVLPAMAHVGTALQSGDLPGPMPPGPNLIPSFKYASQYVVASGDKLTYTIRLINTGTRPGLADVADRLPAETSYVADSANQDGVYDPIRATVIWRGITVPVMGDLSLSFVVTMNTVSAPTMVNNTAIISSGNGLLERRAWVTLIPSPILPRPNLYLSQKHASRQMAIPDETLTYTIRLVNWGGADAIADVTDPLPALESYVPGSATDGGVYNSGTGTLAWQGVTVPVRSQVVLSYLVTMGRVTTPTAVMNTAVISAGGVSFERPAWVLLMPERPAPRPNLQPSHKIASQYVVVPDELLTYTVRLRNVGTADAVVTVTDRVPTQMNYVADTANLGGLYDATARTLSWSGLTVPMQGDVSLTFAVTASATSSPTIVVNTAVISTGLDLLERRVPVLLLPSHPPVDPIPPVVHSLTIDDQDVLTSPTVTLHISATDNVGVRWMYLREWQWARVPWPHWEIGQSSGWVPYQESYTWTLGSEAGTHFVGVWVADAARNTSRLDRRSIDFASLLVPGAAIPYTGGEPYLVYYDKGVNVNAVVSPITGDADLFVWYAGHLAAPVATASKVVSFTTPASGVYVFMVRGQPGWTYDLTISPGGGPRLPLNPSTAQRVDTDSIAAVGADLAATDDSNDLIALLTESALNPPDVAEAPSTPNAIYLPIVMR